MRGRLAELAPPRRPWRDRRALLVDGLVWLVGSVPVVVGRFVPGAQGLWWTVPFAVLAVAALVAVARLYPLVSLVAVLAVALAEPDVVYLAPLLAFLAGCRMRTSRPALVVFAAVVAVGTVATPLLGIPLDEWLSGMMILLLTMVFPWLAGRSWRQYQQLNRAGWERAEQLEHEQRIISDRARLRERARIASDMHDSLGHELSLLGLRAGAFELAPGLDDDQRQAARELRRGAAAATDRLHEIIGVLREETEEAPLEPVDETIEELVRRTADSGMAVDLVDEAGAEADDDAAVWRAAHRVVQEALTNAAKHAPGAAVTVRLQRAADELVVEVRNGAAQRTGESGQPGGRRGLVELRERVRLVGGSLTAAATADAGYAVSARLPRTAEPDGRARPTVDEGTEHDTESARALATARRRARRSLVVSVLVPSGIAAVLGVVVFVQYAYQTYVSTLPPQQYAALQVGASRADVADRLPAREYEERPRVVEPARPAGATCVYYRVGRNVLNLPSDIYRLCFVDGRLARKDRIDGDAPRRPRP